LERRGPLNKRDLQRYANAPRFGTEKFNAVLKALVDDRQIAYNAQKQYQIKEAIQ